MQKGEITAYISAASNGGNTQPQLQREAGASWEYIIIFSSQFLFIPQGNGDFLH